MCVCVCVLRDVAVSQRRPPCVCQLSLVCPSLHPPPLLFSPPPLSSPCSAHRLRARLREALGLGAVGLEDAVVLLRRLAEHDAPAPGLLLGLVARHDHERLGLAARAQRLELGAHELDRGGALGLFGGGEGDKGEGVRQEGGLWSGLSALESRHDAPPPPPRRAGGGAGDADAFAGRARASSHLGRRRRVGLEEPQRLLHAERGGHSSRSEAAWLRGRSLQGGRGLAR